MHSIPDFRKLRNYDPKFYVAVDFETTYIKKDGNVDKIWCIGWKWWENGKRQYSQVHWKDGITVTNLASMLGNVHTKAQISKKPQLVRLSQLLYLLKERPAAFHNAGFDKRLFDALGVDVPCYHDTMMVTYLTFPPATLVENVGDEDKLELYSLRSLGERGFCAAKLESPDFNEFTDELLVYNEGDLDATCDLMDNLAPILYNDPDLLTVYIDVEMPSIELALVMSRRGVRIPDQQLDELILECEEIVDKNIATIKHYLPIIPSPNKPKAYNKQQTNVIDEYDSWSYENLGKYIYQGKCAGQFTYRPLVEFNPGSSTHKRFALKHLFNWESSRTTKTGNSSVDKHALKQLQEEVDHPFVDALLDHSRYSKLLNSFLVKWKDDRDEDLRIHPSFISVATATGRYSSRNPNFQNITGSIKKAIVAADGNVIVYVDLSQAELRILAYYMMLVLGDNQLWSLYCQDADVHSANMKLMGLNKEQRVIAKRAIFLKIYGGGAGILAKSCDVPIDKARVYLAKFNEIVPGIDNLAQAVRDAVYQSSDGAIRSLKGRKIQYPAFKKYYNNRRHKAKVERAFRQIFNSIFQGSNFDITTMLLWEALPYCYKAGGHPIIQVHDSGVFEVPEGNAGWFADDVYRIFNRNDILEGLPLKGMPGIGKTWEQAEDNAKENEEREKQAA